MFGTGTACVVCPIDGILYRNQRIEIPTMKTGAVIMNRAAKQLNDIQYGRAPHEWSHHIE